MFYFNDRSQGIFADGYTDRDGLPVGDTFAYLLRAKLVGTAGRNWTKDRIQAFVSKFSSPEMNAMACPHNAAHLRVEYHPDFYGGAPRNTGQVAYVPQTLVDLLNGDVSRAFKLYTGTDAIHVMRYDTLTCYTGEGELLEEVESNPERIPATH